jgi:hypothetical protein
LVIELIALRVVVLVKLVECLIDLVMTVIESHELRRQRADADADAGERYS